MKIKVHLRVGYNKRLRRYPVAANAQPNHAPLNDSLGKPLPTVAFAVILDVPDRLFSQAEQVIAELTIPEAVAEIAAEVKELGR